MRVGATAETLKVSQNSRTDLHSIKNYSGALVWNSVYQFGATFYGDLFKYEQPVAVRLTGILLPNACKRNQVCVERIFILFIIYCLIERLADLKRTYYNLDESQWFGCLLW